MKDDKCTSSFWPLHLSSTGIWTNILLPWICKDSITNKPFQPISVDWFRTYMKTNGEHPWAELGTIEVNMNRQLWRPNICSSQKRSDLFHCERFNHQYLQPLPSNNRELRKWYALFHSISKTDVQPYSSSGIIHLFVKGNDALLLANVRNHSRLTITRHHPMQIQLPINTQQHWHQTYLRQNRLRLPL